MNKLRHFFRTRFFPNLITLVVIGTTVSFSSMAAYKLSQHTPLANKTLNNANAQTNMADKENNSKSADIEGNDQQGQNSNTDTQEKAKNLFGSATSSGNNTDNTKSNNILKRIDGDDNESLEDNGNLTNNPEHRQGEAGDD